jgi:tetratricopeptide (TPR) repeat protein
MEDGNIEQLVAENPRQPRLWEKLALKAFDGGDMQKGTDLFSRGLSYTPFDVGLFLMRGRKWIGQNRFYLAVADLAMASRFDPDNWDAWYYQGVANNLADDFDRAIICFKECLSHQEDAPDKIYPVSDWLFTTNTLKGDKEAAAKVLDGVDFSIAPSKENYSYVMRLKLFKGLITPEDFLDPKRREEEAETPALSIMTMLYGLSLYYTWRGEIEKSNQTLRELLKQEKYHTAFGYLCGEREAKKRGLI